MNLTGGCYWALAGLSLALHRNDETFMTYADRGGDTERELDRGERPRNQVACESSADCSSRRPDGGNPGCADRTFKRRLGSVSEYGRYI